MRIVGFAIVLLLIISIIPSLRVEASYAYIYIYPSKTNNVGMIITQPQSDPVTFGVYLEQYSGCINLTTRAYDLLTGQEYHFLSQDWCQTGVSHPWDIVIPASAKIVRMELYTSDDGVTRLFTYVNHPYDFAERVRILYVESQGVLLSNGSWVNTTADRFGFRAYIYHERNPQTDNPPFPYASVFAYDANGNQIYSNYCIWEYPGVSCIAGVLWDPARIPGLTVKLLVKDPIAGESSEWYIYINNYTKSAPPVTPAPPPADLFGNFSGYGVTSRLLLMDPSRVYRYARDSNIELRFYTAIMPNFSLTDVKIGNASIPTAFYPFGSLSYVYLDKDHVLTNLAFVWNSTLYFITDILLYNSDYWEITGYDAYRITYETLILTDTNTNKTYEITIPKYQLLIGEEKPSLPVPRFKSLLVSYYYNPNTKEWYLEIMFDTGFGVRRFVTDLKLTLGWAYYWQWGTTDYITYHFLLQSTIVEASIFYVYRGSVNPQYVIIASSQRTIPMNYPVNPARVIEIRTFNYTPGDPCYTWVKFFMERNVSITTSQIPACSIQLNTSNIRIVDYTPPSQVGFNQANIEIRNYSIPDWYNLPGWFSLLWGVFWDFFNIVITIFNTIIVKILPWVLSPSVWSMFLLVFIIANAIIALHNPAYLPIFYLELWERAKWFIQAIYDSIIKLAQTVASLIEALNPL